MSITLVTQKIIRTYPGSNVEPLELPSEIARYIEFKNIDILLLYDSFKKREIKIIGVKYSKKRHKLYIAWEFQIIDGETTRYLLYRHTWRRSWRVRTSISMNWEGGRSLKEKD